MKLSLSEAMERFAPGTHQVVIWALLKNQGIKAQKRRSEASWIKLFKMLATGINNKGPAVIPVPVKPEQAM